MALAFQDCCNTNNYFQVENIPGPIYEGSYYYVLTTNGLQFCGTYIELPTDLGYNPPSYNVQTLTKYTNCQGCQSAKNLTCVETVNVIFPSLPGGSNVTVSECECETIKVMTSFCNTQSIAPGNSSAPLSIGIQGGTAPYKVYNNETNYLLTNPTSPSNNIVINSQAPEGTYSLRVEDSYSDFVQYLNCVINIPPAPLNITCLPTAPTIFGANNGRIQLNINGGVQPYTITFEGTASTVNGTIKLYQNLTADTYTYSIIDSGVGLEQQELGPFNCIVVPGPQINYPTDLCVSIPVCGTNYLLSFSWDGTTRQNYRPVYVCSNPTLIGAQQIQIYFNTTQGWITDAYSIGQFQTPQGCTSITNQFKIKQQTLNTTVSSQPTGNWVVPAPQYSFIGSIINVTGSQCVNAPIVVAPIPNSVICNNGSNLTVSKTITVTSGNGPFTYYRNGNPISSPTFNVGPGNYTYYVRGLNNTQSATQTFTVTSQIPTLLNYGSNCNYTIINNTVTNNIVSFASQGTVITNWPTQIISNTTGTLINTSVSLQIRATVILRVELSSSYDINSLIFNTDNVIATSSTYNTNGTTSTITNWQEIVTGDWYQTNSGTGICPVWEKAISLLSSPFTINGGTSTINPLIYIENFELPTVIDSNEVDGCNKPNISFTTEAVVAYLNSPNCINLAQQFEIYDVKQTYSLNNNQGFVYYSYNTPVASTLCGEYTGPNPLPSTPSTTGGVNATYFDHALNATILLPNQTLDELQTEGLLMYVKVTTDKNLNSDTVAFYNNCQGMNLKLRVSLRYEVNRPANVSLNVTDLVPDNTWDWKNYSPGVSFGPIPDDFPSVSPQLTTLGFNLISGPNYQNLNGTVPCGNGGNFNYSSYGTYVWESGLFNLGTSDLGSLNLNNLNSIYAFYILDNNIAQPNGCPLELNWYVRADLINQGYDNSCGDFIYLGESNCYEFQIKFNDGSLTQQVTQGVVNQISDCVIPPPQ